MLCGDSCRCVAWVPMGLGFERIGPLSHAYNAGKGRVSANFGLSRDRRTPACGEGPRAAARGVANMSDIPPHGGKPALCRIVCTGVTEEGQSVMVDWKAWAYPDNSVHFELRGPMEGIAKHTYKKTSFRLAHWLRTMKSSHEGLLLGFGLVYRDHMFPSRLACKRGGLAGDLTDVKAEFSATTLGLLNLFGYNFSTRQSRAQVGVVEASLSAFFARIELDADLHDELARVAPNFQVACSQPPLQDGWCKHMEGLAERLRACPKRPEQAALFLLQTVYEYGPAISEDCPTARGLCKGILRLLGRFIDDRLLSGDFEVDGLGLRPRPAKRQRVDEDMKHFIAVQAVRNKQTRSGSTLLRGIGVACSSAGPKWEAAELAAYQVAGKRVFETSCVLCVVSDGARLGDPPEETIAYMIWSPDIDRSFVGPVQVFWGACRAKTDSAYSFLIPRSGPSS